MKKQWITLFLLLGIGLQVSAQKVANNLRLDDDMLQSDLITNVEARQKISLNGAWKIIVDPFETGYYDYRYRPSENGYFKNRKMTNPSDLIEYDFDNSPELQVPGDWNTQADKLWFYENTIWYKKSFNYQPRDDKRQFLYFGAVNYEATVYLNGEFIGKHTGGFTPFNFEVTDRVKAGSNFVVVKVSNQRQRGQVPTLNFDWWNYGGITRSVHLLEMPRTFIRDYLVQLKRGELNTIAGWVQLDGEQNQQRVTVSIPEAGLEETFRTNDNGYAEFDFRASDLELWSPDNPKLYDTKVEIITDMVSEKIGYRSIQTEGKDILLNGKPIFLKGVCLHEEALNDGGRITTEAEAEELLALAKELGANFVRLAHYPHTEIMTRTADRMGLMVWSEVPVYWTILFNQQFTFENAMDQLTTNITRDHNRASVILWSIANETPRGPERLEFLSKMAQHAKRLDRTRLLTAALEVSAEKDEPYHLKTDDPLGAYLDVYGLNEYLGWYQGSPALCDSITWEATLDKPLIMSEFGGGALQGKHGAQDERWTEEYQEYLYEKQTAMFERINFLRGTTPWILVDFRSPKRPLANIQDYWNRKGLVAPDGQKKKAFFVMKRFYDGIDEKYDMMSNR